jgi:hypothetical protein
MLRYCCFKTHVICQHLLVSSSPIYNVRRVHKQRQHYARGTENFMKTKAIKLDEIGFEWTPRGNTKIKWDEGLDLLVSIFLLSVHVRSYYYLQSSHFATSRRIILSRWHITN